MASKTTTIKLSRDIKVRIDNLRVYPKESYESIFSRMLDILNTCHINPMKARGKLVMMDRQRKMNGMVKPDEKSKTSTKVEDENIDLD